MVTWMRHAGVAGAGSPHIVLTCIDCGCLLGGKGILKGCLANTCLVLTLFIHRRTAESAKTGGTDGDHLS